VRCQAISVVHGWRDEVIPWRNAQRFAEERRAALHLIDTDHGLHSAMKQIAGIFQYFLEAA